MNQHRLLTLTVLLALVAGCTKQAAPAESSPAPAPVDPAAVTATPDFQDQAVFDASPDGVAAAERWLPRTWYPRPDGSKIELRAVEDREAGTIALVDTTDAVLVMHEVGGPASEVLGRIAVLDDGRVLFDAGFLRGPRSVSTIYWLRWDAAAATLVVEKSAAFTAEM